MTTHARRLCVRVIDPLLDHRQPVFGDCAGAWLPPMVAWVSMLAASGVPYVAGPDASHDDGEGLLITSEEPTGSSDRPVLIGPPPEDPEAALALLAERLGAMVVPDLRGVVVLRLDDPGASAKVHLTTWRHPDVSEEAWTALWDELERLGGRVSVFCCPGWVRADGTVVDGREASPKEWRALDQGRARGLAELECHGYTHMHPDTQAWASAADRYTSEDWYREFNPPRSGVEPPLELQTEILARWQSKISDGTAVVAPGEAWNNTTLVAAKAAGFRLFNSWSICRLDLPTPTWMDHVGSPYLDVNPEEWVARATPVVAYWHDRDMALQGPQWAPRLLKRWRDAGATRFWSFAQLAAAYAKPVDAVIDGGHVIVRGRPDVPLRVVAR